MLIFYSRNLIVFILELKEIWENTLYYSKGPILSLLTISFSLDIDTLHHIPIHDKISNENHTLSDTIPLDKLKLWYQNCKDAHGKFNYLKI